MVNICIIGKKTAYFYFTSVGDLKSLFILFSIHIYIYIYNF
jgi:hypothetical protein